MSTIITPGDETVPGAGSPTGEIGRDVAYRDVETNGASTAARLLTDLL